MQSYNLARLTSNGCLMYEIGLDLFICKASLFTHREIYENLISSF